MRQHSNSPWNQLLEKRLQFQSWINCFTSLVAECIESRTELGKEGKHLLTNNGNTVLWVVIPSLPISVLHPEQPLEEPDVVSSVKNSDGCCATTRFGTFHLSSKYLQNILWAKTSPNKSNSVCYIFPAAQQNVCSARTMRCVCMCCSRCPTN